jgi:hypothetical protein
LFFTFSKPRIIVSDANEIDVQDRPFSQLNETVEEFSSNTETGYDKQHNSKKGFNLFIVKAKWSTR